MKEKTATLIADHLTKSFPKPNERTVLSRISLEAYPGDTIAIMGPSGVGKTTLLHILGTLEKPSAGQLTINGTLSSKENAAYLRNHHIGFIFQNFNLLEEYTTVDNVLMPAKIAGIGIRHEADALLKRVNLEDKSEQVVKHLSGGEKQRVAIARAFCNNPDLILADEPTGNLDETNSAIIHDLLIASAKEMNKTLIVVTHNEALANLCDQRYLLHEGTLESRL